MPFERQRHEIVALAKKLLEEGAVTAVLAYAPGQEGEFAVPRFFRNPGELEQLRWDAACTPNLAKYLAGKKEKTAVLAKACDARALCMYLVEGQIARENVTIIGVECPGMKDAAGGPSPGCGECTVKVPPLYDVLVPAGGAAAPEPGGGQDNGAPEPGQDVGSTGGHPPAKRQENPEKPAGLPQDESGKTPEEKLARLQGELDKCILCFACRQACYGCYCKTCFVERNIPNWLPPDMGLGQKMVFHLGRAMHLAGRCVECGACERACPSGVKIRYLIRELTGQCRELYGYSAGMAPQAAPALSCFDLNDRQAGFMGED